VRRVEGLQGRCARGDGCTGAASLARRLGGHPHWHRAGRRPHSASRVRWNRSTLPLVSRPVGAGALVGDPCRRQGVPPQPGLGGRAVAGQHPLTLTPQVATWPTRNARTRRRSLALIGQGLGGGQPAVVVQGGVQVDVADHGPVVAALAGGGPLVALSCWRRWMRCPPPSGMRSRFLHRRRAEGHPQRPVPLCTCTPSCRPWQ
jgi:hypothetical protein